MFLPRVSIQRPVLTSMMSLALLLFGIIGLTRLPVRELPDIDPPIVNVTTVYPGANASVVETEITERLEEEINNIEGIKTITSDSREQVSNITIEFTLERDIEVAAQDVRDRVARVRGRLPEDIEEPIVAKQDADAQAVMWIGMNSERYSPIELTRIAEDQIKVRLQTVRGVSSITLSGEKRFAIRLWLDSEKMAARQITVVDVQRALQQQNVELPSGRVENTERELTIETRGELKTAEEFNNLVLKTEGTALVRLKDVGEARVGVENERTIARSNGREGIALGVIKQSKANTVEVAQGIKRELANLKPMIPSEIEIIVGYDESIYVEKAIDEVWVTLAIAFVLVVLVIFIFLRNVRSTIIPATAIPVSIIGTFAMFQVFGYSINILTMLALVLAIGVVVDDAIVVLENIYRHLEEGTPPLQAAFKAMDEIAFAILAITFSLVAVFIPVAFQTSATGRLFIEFAMAVAGSVVISAFVALSLTPMMAARILKPVHQQKHGPVFNAFERFFDRLSQIYGRMLRWALAHSVLVIIAGVLTLGLMVLSYQVLEKEFLPEEDKGRLLIRIVAPEGATSEYTDRMLKKIEGFVREIPEQESFFSVVASARSGPGQANEGLMFMTFKEDRSRGVQEILGGPNGLRAKLMRDVEGALAIPIVPKAIGRSFGQPFQLVLQNQDLEALDAYATSFANKLRAEGILANVRSNFEVNKPEVRIRINRNRAATLGVSIEDISRTLQILFGGVDLSRIKLEGKEYDVIVQLERDRRRTPQDLERLYVRNQRGDLIQMNSLVTYDTGAAPNAIRHYDRLRSAIIEGTPMEVPLGTVVDRVEQLLKEDLPPGFLYTWAGEARDLRDADRELWFMIILAILIVYMVLAAQFESLIHPFTVILSLPLAAVGAFGLLWLISFFGKIGWMPALPGMNLNMFSQIGLVLLIGLVTKNAILLVEFANQQREKGVSASDAMYQAGLVRLRPILMTAFSTVAGILPIAIGFGAGAESRRPMGVAVLGGMVTSTFLTLFIIPVVYTVLSRKKPKPIENPTPPKPVP